MSFESLKANLHEYQLRHLIRAHSAGGNVSDRTTPVNDAAFELAPDKNEFVGTLNETLSYTNICATCGLNIVNLIDTESGKIVKRFNDDAFVNRLKEVYYRLAWTVLNGSSVLVAAGEHGQLKVILPKISSCLARIDAHSKPIRTLLFDYKYKNILFTGSEDHEIKIWRLDIKEGKTDLECECSSELLGTIEYNTSNKNSERVNSMCFLPDRYLLISTELGNYYVKVNLRKMLKAKEKKADGNKLENIDENISKDKALEFMMSTDSADKKDNRFTAESIKIETTSGKRHSTVVKSDFISNSLIFINNLLYINEIGSKNLHVIELETGEDKLKLKFIDTLVISEDKCTANSRTSYFIENETSYILSASSEGRLNCCELDAFGRKLKMVLEYELPSDYTIKPVGMAAARTEVKNYDLFDRARVLYATSSDNSIVAVTDQNIIAVFKRFIPATANVVINLNMVQIQ